MNKDKPAKKIPDSTQNVFNSLPVSYVCLDSEKRIKAVNRFFTETFGYSNNDILGVKLSSLLDRDSQKIFRNLNFTNHKDISEVRIRIKAKSGKDLITIFHAGAVLDPETKRAEYHCVMKEKTKQFEDEQETLRNEAKFKQLFDNIKGGVAIFKAIDNGKDFIFTDFNAAAERIDKIKKEQVIGKRLSKVFPKAEKLGFTKIFRRVWKTGIPEAKDLTYYDDGRISGWRQNYIYRQDNGEIAALYYDITAEKNKEAELKASKENYQFIVENQKDVIAMVSRNGFVEYLSPTAKDFGGWDVEEAVGKHMSRFFSDKKDQLVAYAKMKEMAEKNTSSIFEFDFKPKGREPFRAEVTAKPIVKDGKVTGFASVLRDISARLEVRKTLEEQNAFLNTIIDSLSHPFYVVNADDYTLAIANQAALQGRDIKQMTCYKISHKTNKPCSTAEHSCTLAIVKETKKPVTLEHVHFDRDGKKKYVNVYGYPIFDSKGNVKQMIEYSIDVTEKKKMEMELEMNEMRFRQIFDNMRRGVGVFRAVDNGNNFIFVDFNRSAETMLKAKREDVIGKDIFSVCPDAEEKGLIKALKKAWKYGGSYSIPARHYPNDPTPGWKDYFIYKMVSGELVSICEDVTEMMEKEEKLKIQNHFLTTIINSLSHPFYVIDVRDYSLVLANDAALQGRAMDNLTCYNISHKGDKPCNSPEHGCTLKIVRETKKPTTLEHIHFDREGKPKFVEVHGYPIFNSKGEVTQMIEYCIDISERKKIEKALEERSRINKGILDNAPFGIYVVDETGCVEYVNPAMLEISGTPKDHFMGLNLLDHKFYSAIGLSAKIKGALDGQRFKMDAVKYTSTFAHKTTVRNLTGIPFQMDEQKRALIFVEDITALYKAKEETQKRNEELEKFNEIAIDRELRMVELKKKLRKYEAGDGKNKI